MSEKHNDAVAHANTPVQAAKKALQSLAESKTANEVDDVVAELERSSLQDPKQTSPLLQKQERAKRRRSSKLDSMQDFSPPFSLHISEIPRRCALLDDKPNDCPD